jgi:hypothetical protein
MDHFTKWPEAFALPNKEAATVAKTIFSLYCRNLAPFRILTDNGKEFVNSVSTPVDFLAAKTISCDFFQLNASLNNLDGIKHSMTRAYNPQVSVCKSRVLEHTIYMYLLYTFLIFSVTEWLRSSMVPSKGLLHHRYMDNLYMIIMEVYRLNLDLTCIRFH